MPSIQNRHKKAIDEDEEEFDPSTIDFSDIEEKYRVEIPSGFANVVVIDHIPTVDDAKREKLVNVIKKIFKNCGSIKEGGVHIPYGPDGKSKGFMFVEFENEEQAALAIKQGDGYKLDKNHTFSMIKFDDIDAFANMEDEFVEPTIEEFKPKDHLKSWLMDPKARDQLSLYKADEVDVYWNNKGEKPDKVVPNLTWRDTQVVWSPKGSYLATFHPQGIVLWGGPSMTKIVKFAHQNVKLIDFSPNESYLVTWSLEPFSVIDKQRHHIAFWEVSTGQLLRSFPLDTPFANKQAGATGNKAAVGSTATMDWPVFKWSFDDAYFAKITRGPQGAISVYETPGMGLLDKKSLKVANVEAFEWSPSDHIISYWTPEAGDIPARMTLVKFPTREIVRTKNLFNVTECKLFWQSQGEFLLVRVDRMKSKKVSATNFELFRVKEKDIPVDVLETKTTEEITSLAWEPNGNRFIVLSTDAGKPVASFYQVEASSASTATVGIKQTKVVDAKGITQVVWSPKGRFCVLAGVRGLQGDLQFWDTDDLVLLGSSEHDMCTDIEWDPTGRYVVSSVSFWKIQTDTGFIMWTFAGQQVMRQNIPKFKQLLWRPRPPTLLSADQQKKISKNLKSYAKEFEEETAYESNKTEREAQHKLYTLWTEWMTYKRECQATYDSQKEERIDLYGFDPDAGHDASDNIEELEEWMEELIEEVEEIID